jgi:hypothetical protein
MTDEADVPHDLEDLELYAKDAKLCKMWPELLAAWQVAHPNLDVVQEVRRAHAWEMANKRKRKKDRARFLANWLARQKPNGAPPLRVHDPHDDQPELPADVVEELEAGAQQREAG